MKLAAVVRLPDQAAHETMLDTYAEDLGVYPLDLLEDACREWRRKNSFFPTIAELIKVLKPRHWKRLCVLERLITLEEVAEHPAPDGVVSFDWLRQRRSRAVREVQALMAA